MLKAPLCFLIFAIAAPAQQVTAPLILEGNAPLVELEFPTASGGVRKARVLVDTGGGALLLGSRLMADIGAKPNGPPEREEGETIVPLGPVTVRLGGMDLDLSGVSLFGIPASRWTSTRDAAEGMVPARLLRHYDVVFDYPARRFTLAKAGTLKPRGVPVKAPVSTNNGFPRIELQIGGSSYGFLLDTGASFTMISRAALDGWANENLAWPRAIGAVGFANMFGGPMETEALMLRIPELKIGSLVVNGAAAVSRPEGVFEKWMSGMMTAPIVGALAGNVLRDFRVQIDYRDGVAYFERSGNNSDLDLVSIGLVLAGGPDGDLVVTGISSNAAPDVRNSVHAGDKLIAVDAVRLSGRPLSAAAQALQGSLGSTKRLDLERNGKPVTVTVTVKALL